MSVGERIKKRRLQLKLSVDYVAEKLGKNRATVYRYEGDDIENMSLDIISKLATVLKVDPAYLMGWKDTEEDFRISSEYHYFPTSISAGIPLDVDGITENNVEKISIPDNILGKWAGRKDIFFTRINGDSMNRVIPDKSLIAVKHVEQSLLKDGDLVVYSDNHDYAVKRFYRDNDRLIFRPDSTDRRFTDYVTSAGNENLVIHGKVVLYIVEMD